MSNRIYIEKGDITLHRSEAIVNAANSALIMGGGVDGAIHRAAGPELQKACYKIGGCPPGEARLTPGFNLKAKYVIHTVGPVWNGGNRNETEILKNAYLNSLKIAKKNNIKSIAFPAISTGIYSFPFERASSIAITTVLDFIMHNEIPEKIFFILFSEKDYQEFKKIYEKLSKK